MKQYDPSSLKWGITDKSDRLVCAFNDQRDATNYHATLTNSEQFKIIDVPSGTTVKETAGDRVS